VSEGEKERGKEGETEGETEGEYLSSRQSLELPTMDWRAAVSENRQHELEESHFHP